jgi:DNA-binding NarL/FixJ family response regulator
VASLAVDPEGELFGLAQTRRVLDGLLAESAEARRAIQKSCRELEATFERIRGERVTDVRTFSPHIPRPAMVDISSLTKRELDVLRLIAEGMSTKEMAAELKISFKTAVSHRTHLLSKLKVHESASLVRIAIRAGVIAA